MGLSPGLRWGLWGTGRVSWQVAQDLHLVAGARVTAVGGRRLDAARALAAMHPGAQAVDRLDALLGSDQVDAVYIATPDACHRDDVMGALAAGKAVLCEKPLTASLADAQALIDEARRRQVFLMEGLWTLFLPAISRVKQRIDAGEIGAVRLMRGSFVYPDGRPTGPYGDPATAMLYDRGIYPLALALHLLPAAVRGARAHAFEVGGGALLQFVLEFEGGAVLDAVCGSGSHLANGFEIVGERGSITLADPFFKAQGHALQLVSASAAPPPAAPSRADRSGARWVASAKQLKRATQWLPQALRGARAGSSDNFPGNGYQFQFEEVGRCLAAGRHESERASLQRSLDVARALHLISSSRPAP